MTPPSGPNAAQNPGQDLSRHRAVPDWLEPLFLSLDAMAIDTIIGLVTGLALPFFPDCIKRMYKAVAQLVLSLQGLNDSPSTGRRSLQYTVCRSPGNT